MASDANDDACSHLTGDHHQSPGTYLYVFLSRKHETHTTIMTLSDDTVTGRPYFVKEYLHLQYFETPPFSDWKKELETTAEIPKYHSTFKFAILEHS